jgi:quinol monooxygenase YgiN
MPGDTVTVVIRYEARPDAADAALAALAALVATVVREEPDCLGIRVYRDLAEPGRILLDEEWTSREAYLGPHLTTPHLTAFVERAPALFTGPPEITFWERRADVRRG